MEEQIVKLRGLLPRCRGHADPTLQVFLDYIRQCFDMQIAVIQAGNVVEVFATRVLKAFSDFLVDLFQGFNAIRRKSGGADGYFRVACFRLPRNFFNRIGFQPFFRPELGLEACHDFAVVPPKPFLQQPGRFLTLAVIRITLFQIPLGYPVI